MTLAVSWWRLENLEDHARSRPSEKYKTLDFIRNSKCFGA